jgi:IS30 family transposase
MSKLDLKARMTIETLAAKGVSHSEIARILGVTDGR